MDRWVVLVMVVVVSSCLCVFVCMCTCMHAVLRAGGRGRDIPSSTRRLTRYRKFEDAPPVVAPVVQAPAAKAKAKAVEAPAAKAKAKGVEAPAAKAKANAVEAPAANLKGITEGAEAPAAKAKAMASAAKGITESAESALVLAAEGFKKDAADEDRVRLLTLGAAGAKAMILDQQQKAVKTIAFMEHKRIPPKFSCSLCVWRTDAL